MVKGTIDGQGHGACLLGGFTDESNAQARACQMIVGVKEVGGDDDYGCVPPGDEDYRTEVAIGKERSSYTVTSTAFYGYMDQVTVACVEKHKLLK